MGRPKSCPISHGARSISHESAGARSRRTPPLRVISHDDAPIPHFWAHEKFSHETIESCEMTRGNHTSVETASSLGVGAGGVAWSLTAQGLLDAHGTASVASRTAEFWARLFLWHSVSRTKRGSWEISHGRTRMIRTAVSHDPDHDLAQKCLCRSFSCEIGKD